MAEKIKGITLEIGGDLSGLKKGMSAVNKDINATQKELKQVERLLKLDPKNTELLAQKQELLGKNIETTKDKLESLKDVKKQADDAMSNGTEVNQKQYRELQREIVQTENDLKELANQAKKAGVEQISKGATNLAKGAAIATTAVIGIGASAYAVADKIADAGDEIDKNSQKMGISAEAYQRWDQVCQHSGTSMDSLKKGMATMETKISSNSNAFKQLGVNIDGLSKEEVFQKTILSLQKMEDPIKRNQVAVELFGSRSVQEMGALLNCTNEETKAMLENANVMSNENVKAAAKFKDTQQDLNNTMSALGTEVLSALMPVITDIMNGIREFVSTHKEDIENLCQKVSEFGQWVVDNSSTIIAGIAGVGTAFIAWNVATMINGVVKSIKAFKLANEGASIAQWALNTAMNANPIGIVIAVIAGLVAAIVVLWNKNEGFRNACINAWESIKNAFQSAINSIKGFFNKLITWLKEFPSKMVNIGKNIVEGIWKGITNAKEWLKNKIKGWVDGILSNIKDFFGIHSPSTKTAEFGKYLSQGLGVGITEDMSAEKAMQQKCQNLTNILNEWLNNVTSDTDIANKQLELWQLQNPNATETEKADMTLKNLNVQRENSEDKIKLINDALWEQNQLTGENSAESKALQKQLLEEQIAYEKLADSIEEANTAKSNAMALDKYNEDVKRNNYYNYLKQNTALLKSVGYSQSQIEEAARKDSGYTGNKNVNIQQNFYTQTATPSSTYNATKKAMNDASVAVAF